MSVSTRPGATALTVTPRAATSRATDLVNPITPAFAAPYAASPVFPSSATTAATCTTPPYPTRPGRRACRSCGERLARERDAVRVARRDAHQRRRDPPGEPGEYPTGARLEGERGAERGERAHRLLPTHGRGHLLDEQPGQLRPVANRTRFDAGHDRQPGRVKDNPGQMTRQPTGRRLHQRAVERRADGEEPYPRALGGRQRQEAIHRARVPRDDDLAAPVQVRRHQHVARR